MDGLGGLRPVRVRPKTHALWRNFGHDGGLRDVLPARPDAGRARIARCGRHPVPKRARNKPRILVEPMGVAFGFGKHEPARDELLRAHVELPQHRCVAAAARQPHDGQRVIGRQRRCALPDPVLVLLGSEPVEIEEHRPFRFARPELVQRRRAPETPRMRRIFPEIEHERPAARDVGNVVGPVEDRLQGVPVRREAGAAELVERRRSLRIGPAGGLCAVDVFQPKIRIVVWRRRCRTRVVHHVKTAALVLVSVMRRQWDIKRKVPARQRRGGILRLPSSKPRLLANNSGCVALIPWLRQRSPFCRNHPKSSPLRHRASRFPSRSNDPRPSIAVCQLDPSACTKGCRNCRRYRIP